MSRSITLVTLAIAACSMSQEFLSDGAVRSSDGGSDGGAPGGPPPGAVICGGTTCTTGQTCCFVTLTCVDASTPGACALPAGAPPGACASNADCAPTQYCNAHLDGPIHSHCGGPGTCVDRLAPGGCGTLGPVCGCDGRTYPTDCEASARGVRVVGIGPCGSRAWPDPGSMEGCGPGSECSHGWLCDVTSEICYPPHPLVGCGNDAQCTGGSVCCGFTGLCVDPARPDLCTVPPDDTLIPCASDADCAAFNEDLVPIPTYMCVGPGCTAPGGCARAAFASSCGGELAPVCGCDGTSYSNDCWASTAVTRIAHAGMCP